MTSRSQPKPENKSERKIQIFDEYSVPFTAQAITLNEEFLKGVLGYLYPVAKEENLTTSNETNPSTARIMAGIIDNGNGGYLVFGICMLMEGTTTKTRFDHCPYIFLCNDSRLSFWRTEVPNYGYSAAELDNMGMSGIIRYSPEFFNVLGCLGFTSSNNVRIPYKSAFLEGKYENIISSQNKINYIVTTNSLNRTFYYRTGEHSAPAPKPAAPVQQVRTGGNKNLRRKK